MLLGSRDLIFVKKGDNFYYREWETSVSNITVYCFLYPSKARLLRRGKRNFVYIHWGTKYLLALMCVPRTTCLLRTLFHFLKKSFLACLGWLDHSIKQKVNLQTEECSLLILALQQVPARPGSGSILQTAYLRKRICRERWLRSISIKGTGRHRICEVQDILRGVSPADLRCLCIPSLLQWTNPSSQFPPGKRQRGGRKSYLDHWNCLV